MVRQKYQLNPDEIMAKANTYNIVHEDAHESPKYNDLNFDPTRRIFQPNTKKDKETLYVWGCEVRIDETTGNIIQINVSGEDGVLFSSEIHPQDVFEFFAKFKVGYDGKPISSAPITFAVHHMYELEACLKTLGEALCTKLIEIGPGVKVQRDDGVAFWYTPGLTITVHTPEKTYRIVCLQAWCKGMSDTEAMDYYGLEVAPKAHIMYVFGNRIKKELWNQLGPLGGDIASPSILTRSLFANVLSGSDRDYPEEVSKLSYEGFHGQWIDMFLLGRFKTLLDYDLNSAYPHFIKKLPNLGRSNGIWTRSSTYQKDAVFGMCMAHITINPTFQLNPIAIRKLNKLFYVTGSWTGFINKLEIDLINDFKLGKVDIQDGWWFRLTSPLSSPFEDVVRTLAIARQAGEMTNNNILRYGAKSAGAAISGKFLETRFLPKSKKWLPGPNMDPIYYNWIVSLAKDRLARLALMNKDNVGGVVVDGLLSTKPLNIALSKAPGDFKLSGEGDGVLLHPTTLTMRKGFSPYDVKTKLETIGFKRDFISISEKMYLSLTQAIEANMFDKACTSKESVFNVPFHGTYTRSWSLPPKDLYAPELLTHQYKSEPHSVWWLQALINRSQQNTLSSVPA